MPSTVLQADVAMGDEPGTSPLGKPAGAGA